MKVGMEVERETRRLPNAAADLDDSQASESVSGESACGEMVSNTPPPLRESLADESMTDIGEAPFLAAPVLEIDRGSVLAGRYQIERIIGKGGSGLVLRAFDRIAQQPVAVKILKPELAANPHWVERFSRELRLARQIQHPNVCRVFDIGEADGHKFLTMELGSESTLRTAVRPMAPVRPMSDRIADARALVAGIAAIHSAGIVHRDIKPENLLRMEDGRLVVSD